MTIQDKERREDKVSLKYLSKILVNDDVYINRKYKRKQIKQKKIFVAKIMEIDGTFDED